MRGVEKYLGQIKRLEEDDQLCTGTVLAQTLKVSLPSASEMLKRLAGEGFVDRGPHGAVTLTGLGRPVAHRVLRKHRVIERLLTDILGMQWRAVHSEAHRLEHEVSPSVEEHLVQRLGFPEYCPHGHPICPVDTRTLKPFDSCEPGEEVAIAQMSETREEMLDYFERTGLTPAAIVKVIDVSSPNGPLTLLTDAGDVSIAREAAALIKVCLPEENDWLERRSI